MTQIDPHIFRAYDIRGTVGDQLTPEVCTLIGWAYGTELRERYDLEHPNVILGRDARTSGPELEEATLIGLLRAGCHVQRMGETPSPVNYFTICQEQADGGIQLTASHNPGNYNGMKLQMRNAEAFSDHNLQRLRERIEEKKFLEGNGSATEIDANTPYVAHLAGIFGNVGENVKVVVDAGNGIAGPLYCELLRAVGCEVVELYTEPDGTFPNHIADPSNWETLKDLQARVQEEGAHLGFAFDGDGDRLGVVDENGDIKNADEIMLLLAQDHLTRHAGGTIVFTVSNSSRLQTEVEKWGGKPVMCIVGHSFVEHAMHEHGAELGGEQSGHFFCAEDYYPYDDAAAAALRVLAIAAATDSSFSAQFADFPQVFQAPEYRPSCPDGSKVEVIEKITEHFSAHYPVNTLDGVRIDFGDGAWAGVRKSNTSPCISVCIEARSPEKLEEVQQIIHDELAKYPEIGE